jgi:hypothetical protein
MPDDDLLRFIGGPLPFSGWWVAFGVLCILIVMSWYASVFVWTLPPSVLRRVPVIRSAHAWINRRRFARIVSNIDALYRAGGLAPAQAGAAISRALRGFLYLATGIKAQYIHVQQLADGPLGAAAPLLEDLNEAQFNPEARADVGVLARSAGELISSWT